MPPLLVLLLCRSGIVRARVVRGQWWVHHGDFAPWVHLLACARPLSDGQVIADATETP